MELPGAESLCWSTNIQENVGAIAPGAGWNDVLRNLNRSTSYQTVEGKSNKKVIMGCGLYFESELFSKILIIQYFRKLS